MRKIFAVIAALFLCAASPAFGADPALRGDSASAAKVLGAFQNWLVAYEKGDLASSMAIFDKDVIFSFQGARDQNFADLQKGYEMDFASRAPGTVWAPVIDEVYAAGSLAFVRSVWELRVKAGNGNVEVKERNRSIDVLRNSADGWKIIRSLNYPERR